MHILQSSIVCLITLVYCGMGNIDLLELIMPRYVIRGGDVLLRCEHNVLPEHLYKVEWQRAGMKIYQYIKDRKPPFRYFPVVGAELNKANSSAKQLHLMNLDFDASGSYSCVVTLETPIFSKDSESQTLTVIDPQDKEPTITFDKSTYMVGEVLQANCTTAPARPPPHITWLINGEKVDEKLTKTFGIGRTPTPPHRHDQRAGALKQLSIEVSELHVGDNGELWLTCLSTIPGYVGPKEQYADAQRHSIQIEVIMTDSPAEIKSSDNTLVENTAIQWFPKRSAFVTILFPAYYLNVMHCKVF